MTINIGSLIQKAVFNLQHYSDSPQLDAELLLAYVLHWDRAYLKIWQEKLVDEDAIARFETLIKRRVSGEPVAYILGYKEFWSIPIKVNSSVLIPRSETELLVETVLAFLPKAEALQILDLGTGSGAIALALANERPHWQIIAIDKSSLALKVAEENAQTLGLSNIIFKEQDWFSGFDGRERFHAIVSNPPYISTHHLSHCSRELVYEPREALFSGETGMVDLSHIISMAPSYLYPEGWLFLEHGFDQRTMVQTIMVENDYTEIQFFQDMSGCDRVIVGRLLK